MYLPGDIKYGLGSTVYVAKNPDFGAIITYYIKEVPKTKKETRKEKEKDLFKKGEPIPQPSEDDLRAEKNELDPFLTFTITDERDNPVRIIRKSMSKGIGRVNWDLRYQSVRPVDADKFDAVADNGSGILAMPGNYKVSMTMTAGGETKLLAGPVQFMARVISNTSFPPADRQAVVEFNRKVAELTRIVQGTENYAETLYRRVTSLLQAMNSTPKASPELLSTARNLQLQLDNILNRTFNHRTNKPSEEENPPSPVTLNQRLGKLSGMSWSSTGDPTKTQMDAYSILMDEFPPVYDQVKLIGETDVPKLEKALESLGAPVTPGRLPEWKK